MNFRKSLRSMHHQTSQSMKKMQQIPQFISDLNNLDLQQCNNLYSQSAQSTKESENSILNKLLLQPPSMKQFSTNKLTLQSTQKKYQPKFAKPDVQNLIQQNINLKNVIKADNQSINLLKIKNAQLDKKIKLLQKGLQKVEKQQIKGNNKENAMNFTGKENVNSKTYTQKDPNSSIYQQPFANTGLVHTQILKKKIADLTSQNISAQNELKFLKKLPNITIYQENDTQKQHLIAQTIRLKSIITSLSQQPASDQSQKFQNQFMRLMKEQNQKLKATIRLLQNDKILLKSRQTIQNKLNSDLKKQIDHFKSKLLYKQSQLQKINNQNKNLLFKKTTQFRQQQQKKENQVISQLKAKLVNLDNERIKLQQNNEFYCEQNIALKQKEKNLTQQITQIESKYDKVVKKLNEQIDQLQFQLNNLKTDYINLLNSGTLKKKKSLGIAKQPSNNNSQLISRDSFYAPSPLSNQKHHFSSVSNLYFRPVKWQEISIPMAHLYTALEQNPSLTIQTMISNVQQNDSVKCCDLVNMFIEQPFNITRKQAIKLARYICQDSSTPANTKVLYNQNITIQSSLAKTILASSLQNMTNKLSPHYLLSWQKILKKTKKLPTIINEFLQNKTHVKKQELLQLIDKYSRQKVELEEYDFMVLTCMEKQLTQDQFVLSVRKIHDLIQQVLELSNKENDEMNR